jgi:hypothetical protein
VRYDAKDHQRSLEVMRAWGLVPFWAKDIKVGFANINAKAEGIENKPAFREVGKQYALSSARLNGSIAPKAGIAFRPVHPNSVSLNWGTHCSGKCYTTAALFFCRKLLRNPGFSHSFIDAVAATYLGAKSGLARATHGHGHDGCWLRRGMGLSAMRETSRPS